MAGLRGDDIITRIGDMDIPDLQAMTDALRSHQPGDSVHRDPTRYAEHHRDGPTGHQGG